MKWKLHFLFLINFIETEAHTNRCKESIKIIQEIQLPIIIIIQLSHHLASVIFCVCFVVVVVVVIVVVSPFILVIYLNFSPH